MLYMILYGGDFHNCIRIIINYMKLYGIGIELHTINSNGFGHPATGI